MFTIKIELHLIADYIDIYAHIHLSILIKVCLEKIQCPASSFFYYMKLNHEANTKLKNSLPTSTYL